MLYELINGKGKVKEYDGVIDEKLQFEGEYLNVLKWNGKGYNYCKNVIYELNNGNGLITEYDNYGKLIFEGKYLNRKKMEKEKNIMIKTN